MPDTKQQTLAAEAATARPDAADLEHMPVDQVLTYFAVQPDRGLSNAEAAQRLANVGPNALVEKETSLAAKIFSHFTGPTAAVWPEQRKSSSNNDVLRLVAGGHLLLFITRNERWFFLPPFPAASLFLAIVLTQLVAVLMCGIGLLVPAIPWTLIGWVWAYNIGWMFILCAVRLATEHLAAGRTARWMRSASLVNQPLAAA